MKYIKSINLLFLLLTFAFPLVAMKRAYSSKGKEGERKKHLERAVLIANNGTRFAIPGNSIKYSKTILSLLSTLRSQEEQTGKISFSNINAQDLAIVADVFNELGDVNLSGKELLDSLKKKVSVLTTLSNDRLLSLLSVANFLDFPVLLQFIAQQVAGKIKNKSLNLKEVKNTFNTVPPILAEVGRQYYLLIGGNYLKMGVNYGFSVKELYEHGKGKEIRNNELKLKNMRINSLEGLDEQTIPGFKNLEELDLSHNQLTSLPEGLFNNCTTLTMLYLPHNQLTNLPEGLFNNCTALGMLDLSNNKLTTLPKGLFNNLTTLCGLDLSRNKLTSLPGDLFNNFTGLFLWLNLSKNKLTSLPEGLFNNCTALEWLNLSKNQLSESEKQKIKRALGQRSTNIIF